MKLYIIILLVIMLSSTLLISKDLYKSKTTKADMITIIGNTILIIWGTILILIN